MRKDCEEIREQMTAYLAGELPPDEAAHLRAHLETCSACSRDLDELSAVWRKTKSMLDSCADSGPLPEANRSAIRRALTPERGFRMRSALWKIAAMFFVCGVILSVFFLSGRKDVPDVRMDVFMDSDELLRNASVAKQSVASSDTDFQKTVGIAEQTVLPSSSMKAKAARPVADGRNRIRKFEKRASTLRAEPETDMSAVVLKFEDYPEIGIRTGEAVASFFGKQGIPLKEREITVRDDVFEIRTENGAVRKALENLSRKGK